MCAQQTLEPPSSRPTASLAPQASGGIHAAGEHTPLTFWAGSLAEARQRVAHRWGVGPDQVRLTIQGRANPADQAHREQPYLLHAVWQETPAVASPVELYCHLGEVFVVAYPASEPGTADLPAGAHPGDGQSASLATLQSWPMDSLDASAVARAFSVANGEPVNVGHMRPTFVSGMSAPLAVKIDADGVRAWLIPWAQSSFQAESVESLMQMLSQAGVTHGVDAERLERAAAELQHAPLCVAQGLAAQPGQDAALEFVCEALRPSQVAHATTAPQSGQAAAGTAMVEPGQILLRKRPIGEGTAGFSVRGEPVPAAPGHDVSLAAFCGTGVALAEEGMALRATVAGLAHFELGKLEVTDPATLRRTQRRSDDGYFRLEFRRGELILLVDAPAPQKGKPVEAAAVFKALGYWPLHERDEGRVNEAVARAAYEPVVVGRMHVEPEPAEDAPFAVYVTQEQALLLPWAEPQAPAVCPTTVREALKQAGVTFGVDEAALRTLAAEPWTRPVVVARLDQLRLSAPSLESARTQAATTMGIPPEEVEIAVERTEKLGFLGLGGQVLHVLATRKHVVAPVDGTFTAGWSRGHLLITVHKAEHEGTPVEVAAVAEALSWLAISPIPKEKLAPIVSAASGVPVMVEEFLPTTAPADDAPAGVRLSEDALEAYLVPWATNLGTPDAFTAESARAVLAAAGVSAGIDEIALQRLESEGFTTPILVARGTPAQPGQDAALEWHVDPRQEGTQLHQPRVLGDGRADYRDLGGFAAVTLDAVLVTRTPPTPGVPGCTVRGEAIPAAAGADSPLDALVGQNTRVAEDGLTLHATIAGMATLVGEKLAVMPVSTVEGDVDFSVGHVSVDGNVVVRGNVKPGFRVRATGSIQVLGEVDGAASLEAGGDIKVNGGIIGDDATVIEAAGNVQAKYLRHVTVRAGKSVQIAREVLESKVAAQEGVQVNGAIIGGLTKARNTIVAQTLGGPSGAHTHLRAGLEMTDSLDQIQTMLAVSPSVVARRTVHPNVSITINGAHLKVSSELPSTTFRMVDGKITTAPS